MRVKQDQTNSGEIRFSISGLAELPMVLLTIVFFIAAIKLTTLYPESIQRLDIGSANNTFVLPIPLFFIIPICLAVFIIHSHYDNLYIIGEDYVRSISGRLSLKKKDIRLEFHNIRAIEVDRGLYGRIVNVGDISIGTSINTHSGLTISDVYDPSKYRDIIIARMHAHEKATTASNLPS